MGLQENFCIAKGFFFDLCYDLVCAACSDSRASVALDSFLGASVLSSFLTFIFGREHVTLTPGDVHALPTVLYNSSEHHLSSERSAVAGAILVCSLSSKFGINYGYVLPVHTKL